MPKKHSHADDLLLALIRRVNLDMFWSREKSTISSTLSNFKNVVELSSSLGLKMTAPAQGPWDLGDEQGFGTAIIMLRKSMEKGRNADDYQQFDTIRKIRSSMHTLFVNSPQGARKSQSVSFGRGRAVKLEASPTQSGLFGKFIEGCEKRMGKVVNQDRAISVKVLLLMLENYETEWQQVGSNFRRKRMIAMAGAANCILFCGALRGPEIILMEATTLCQKIAWGRKAEGLSFVTVPLMGRVKGERGERNILLPLVNRTKSGIPNRLWIERLVEVLTVEKRHRGDPGPALCDEDGYVLPQAELNEELFRALEKVQEQEPNYITEDTKIRQVYSVDRSHRRGATSRALALNYSDTTINANNRWKASQNQKGEKKNMPMSSLYADILLTGDLFLQFSHSL
jgi:hypothetical protein